MEAALPNPPATSVFRPPASAGGMFGVGVACAALALSAVLFLKGLSMDAEFAQVLPLLAGACCLILGALFAYWAWGRLSLRYTVDRNALSIRWAGLEQVIPIGNIERLIPAGAEETVTVEGVNWTGHHVGHAEIEDIGDVLFYSGHRTMADVLYVSTPSQTYAISVEDAMDFARAVQASQTRGALFEQRQTLHRSGISAQTFWSDRLAVLLGLVLIGAFFAVLGYVLDMYPGLADTVGLRFPSFGGIVRASDKSALLDIPRSAAGFVAVNLFLAIVLHSWERMVSYVLLIAGIVTQAVLLVAAIVAVA